MIVFAITTNVEFLRKPDWLDAFFLKYNNNKFSYHITLKQPCIIEEDQISEIKDKLASYISENAHSFNIDFDKYFTNSTEADLSKSDGVIMIQAKENPYIIQLQKDFLRSLTDYKNYLSPETQEYEENFNPHLTLAYDLNEQTFEAAKKELQDDCSCQCKVTKIILSIVRDYNTEQQARENFVFDLIDG